MSPSKRIVIGRSLRCYLLGQAAILAGALGTHLLHSFVPLALAGSAALMLTVPLVRQLATAKKPRP